MKYYLIICAIACAHAASVPAHDDSKAETVRSNFQNDAEGNFQYAFETSNGIVSQVEGKFKEYGKDEAAVEIQGQNAYVAPDGQKIELTFVADAEGYHPQGDHLPVPPPTQEIPEYILKAQEYIAAHPYQVEKKRKEVPKEVTQILG